MAWCSSQNWFSANLRILSWVDASIAAMLTPQWLQVLRAERTLKKWEADLGDQVNDVQQDLFGPSGRLEGMKGYELSIGERDFEVNYSLTGILWRETHTDRSGAGWRQGVVGLASGAYLATI